MKDCTVLMTGCGAPGAPGIIRCLRKNGERNIRIVSVDRNENAGSRDLVDAFYTVPSAEKEDFIPAVLDICRREGVQVVIPIVTRELMKFARARAEFEAIGARVAVMEPDKLEIVNNKANLLDAMRAHGLRTPEYRRVHTVEELKAAADEGRFEELLMPVDAAFRQYKSIFLSPKQTKMFLDGIRLDTNRIKIPAEGDTVRVYGESRFLALAHIERSIAELQIIKLFYTKENPNC